MLCFANFAPSSWVQTPLVHLPGLTGSYPEAILTKTDAQHDSIPFPEIQDYLACLILFLHWPSQWTTGAEESSRFPLLLLRIFKIAAPMISSFCKEFCIATGILCLASLDLWGKSHLTRPAVSNLTSGWFLGDPKSLPTLWNSPLTQISLGTGLH